MAVSFEGTSFPESTGAVQIDDTPQQYGITVDQTPTGAVENTGEPITTKYGPSGLRPTGAVELPVSQTFRAPDVKVVNAPKRDAAAGQNTAETDQAPRTGRRADATDTEDGR